MSLVLSPNQTAGAVTSPATRTPWWVTARATVGRYGVPRALWSLIIGLPHAKVPKLKPTGYNAFIEQITQPMLIIASLALTTGAVFVMAQGLIQQASEALASGHAPTFQTLLALSTLFVIGFLIDTSLITAGSRFRMHALRSERGWATLSCAMLLLCVAVEGMTWSYLLYELEPTVLPGNVASFIRGIPSVLFFVRAYMGPVCLIYLTAGVLPLTIQRSDVDRQTAAVTGSAIVAVINALVHQIQETGLVSPQHAVQLLDLLLALFRVSAKHQTVEDDQEMVAAFRNLSLTLSPAPGDPGAEDQQRIATLEAAWEAKTAELTALASHLYAFQAAQADQALTPARGGETENDHAEASPEAFSGASRSASTGQRSGEVSTADGTDDDLNEGRSDDLTEGLSSGLAGERTVPTGVRVRRESGGSARSAARSLKPGSRPFRTALYNAVLSVQRAGGQRTFHIIAEHMGGGITADEVKATFEQMRRERLNKLRPGTHQELDPVLDDAALLLAVSDLPR